MKITASNKEEAIEEALKIFSLEGKQVTPEDLIIKEVGSTGGFMGLGKREVYQISIKGKEGKEEKEGEEDEEFIFPIDSTFALSFNNQGVMAKVLPPEGGGKTLPWEEVLSALKKYEVEDPDKKLLLQMVEEASGEWVKIAPRKKELDRNAKITFHIGKRGLEAYADYLPPLGGKHLNKVIISQALKEAGITHGINHRALEGLIGRKEPLKSVLIAQATEPTPGIDATLNYHYEREKKSAGMVREDGTIDFRTLDNIINALPGDLLVSKVPATPGLPGKKVTGEEIPPPKPKDIRLPKGKNVEITEDGLQLKSSIEGQVLETGILVNVFAVYTVNGDVDMEIGNIDFIGNVNIHGDIQEGFKVKARGDVIVKGGVNAATIESGGNIKISKGFQGRKKGIISAKGDIQVMFVENGRVFAQGDVIVDRAVMHSHIQAGGNLVVRGKGFVVGGTIITGKMVEARVIGSSLATPTHIQVGVGPKTRERIMEIEEKIEQYYENLKKTEQGMKFLLLKKKEVGNLPVDKENLLRRMVETHKYLKGQISELEQENQVLGESLMNLQGGRIKVSDKIYSGVILTIGGAQRRIRDSMSHTSFVFEDGEVISKPY